MNKEELHKILDDENKKISLKEFREILYKLKEDCFDEIHKLDVTNPRAQFYYGETNAFFIVLDLSEHIDLEELMNDENC